MRKKPLIFKNNGDSTKYLEQVQHNMEPWEYNLIKLDNCKYGKGKAHLYERNETYL